MLQQRLHPEVLHESLLREYAKLLQLGLLHWYVLQRDLLPHGSNLLRQHDVLRFGHRLLQ